MFESPDQLFIFRPPLGSKSCTSLILIPTFLALGRPREMPNRNNEEAVAVIGNAGKGHPPRQKSRQQCKKPTGFDDLRIWLFHFVAIQVPDSEEEESNVDTKEE